MSRILSCFPHPAQIFHRQIYIFCCLQNSRKNAGRPEPACHHARLQKLRWHRHSQTQCPLHGWTLLETDGNRQGMNHQTGKTRSPSHTRRGVPAGVQIYMIKKVFSYFFFLWGAPNIFICRSHAAQGQASAYQSPFSNYWYKGNIIILAVSPRLDGHT